MTRGFLEEMGDCNLLLRFGHKSGNVKTDPWDFLKRQFLRMAEKPCQLGHGVSAYCGCEFANNKCAEAQARIGASISVSRDIMKRRADRKKGRRRYAACSYYGYMCVR
jgi:hypothetical protein